MVKQQISFFTLYSIFPEFFNPHNFIVMGFWKPYNNEAIWLLANFISFKPNVPSQNIFPWHSRSTLKLHKIIVYCICKTYRRNQIVNQAKTHLKWVNMFASAYQNPKSAKQSLYIWHYDLTMGLTTQQTFTWCTILYDSFNLEVLFAAALYKLKLAPTLLAW